MDTFQDIQWDHVNVLWGLTALPLLGILLGYDWLLKRRLMQRWGPLPGAGRSTLLSAWREARRAILLLSGFGLAVLGFASPTLSTLTREPAWEHVALGLLLDVSPSMRAPADTLRDPDESRLDILKQSVQALIAQLPSGIRLGVIAFAGVSVPIVPEPSADHQAVMAKVRRLDQTFIASPGTNLAAAIRQGLSLFVDTAAEAQPDTVSLLLLSDGDAAVTPQLQKQLSQVTLPIFALGIGMPQPVHIPDAHASSGILMDEHGMPLTTAVNETVLRLIADQTGGAYYPVTEQTELLRVLRQIIMRQGKRVAQPVLRRRSARWMCFLAAFCCLFLYQFDTRPGRIRPRTRR